MAAVGAGRPSRAATLGARRGRGGRGDPGREATAVAAAAGHPLPLPDLDDLTRLLTDPESPMTSSLYRDLQAGRGTEVEQILGDLIGRARALGVATPVLDLATLALRVHQQRVNNTSPSLGSAG